MIGELIEHYRILQRVGEGGMGTVYRALDTQLEREVALKVLRAELSEEPDVTKRFRAEALTLARLSHPHIATLFGLARRDTQLCMVMEYVQGETLAHVLKTGSGLAPERAVRIAVQVLSALDYAHKAGIVHRDVKPSNVIVSRSDTAKVLDFGIARALDADRLTRQGFILGTPQYMAPEQIRGTQIDGRADVYSVGVLLYELLAGRLPFRGENEWALMYAHLEGRATPLAEVLPGAPAWLCDVVARALAKAPEDRFATAAEFQSALEQRSSVPLFDEAPTISGSGAFPEPPSLRSRTVRGGSGRWGRVKSWLLPRFTWEYYAGPDGMLTMRRAVRASTASRPAMTPASAPRVGPLTDSASVSASQSLSDSASRMSRTWPLAVAAVVLLVGMAAAARWLLVERSPAQTPAASAPAAAPLPSPPASTQPAAVPSARGPLPGATQPPDPSTGPRTLSPPRVDPPAPAPVERVELTPAPAPVEATSPGAVPAAAEPAAPVRTTPSIPDQVFEDVVLLIPRESGYDEVEVRVTFERERLVVFDEDEERVVATVDLANGQGGGANVSGTASLLIGSEHWFTVPTSAGRVILQLDDESTNPIVAAFEARTGARVTRARGELGGM